MESTELFLSGGMLFAFLIFTVLLYILCAFPMYKIAQKAGHDHPVWAWIPILNTIQMIQIGGLPIWIIILLFIPYVNIVVSIYIVVKLLQSFDRGSIGMILLAVFIPLVAYYIIAFGEAEYQY